jgi:protein TonB
MLFLLSTVATFSQPSGPPAKVQSLYTYQDYPEEAVRNHWQGQVVADLMISPEGAVTGCRIVQSSGHQVLDDATCDLMVKRARFTPARNKDGKPIESHYRTPPITWALQD